MVVACEGPKAPPTQVNSLSIMSIQMNPPELLHLQHASVVMLYRQIFHVKTSIPTKNPHTNFNDTPGHLRVISPRLQTTPSSVGDLPAHSPFFQHPLLACLVRASETFIECKITLNIKTLSTYIILEECPGQVYHTTTVHTKTD